MKGENVPNFKMNTGISDGTSNVFQILQDLQQKQYKYNSNTVHNYGAHEYSTYSTDGNFFQDHHTLHTSYNSYDS